MTGVLADNFRTGLFPIGAAPEAFAAAFGAAAAILLVGGYVLLRWQRDRQQFLLMHKAMERGINALAGGPPFWVVSLRQGLMILTLGVGLVVVGLVAVQTVPDVEMPQGWQGPMPAMQPGMNGPDRPDAQDRPEFRPDRPEPRMDQRPPGPRRPTIPDRPQPPPQNPAMERWHRAQDQRMVGLLAIGSGVILILLGIVRTSLAAVERRYSDDDSPGPGPHGGG
jgi:hypothetical protein